MAASTSADDSSARAGVSAVAPTNMNRLRRAIEADEPNAALIWVVSAVRRETNSPVRALS